jgi:hypothetical protein
MMTISAITAPVSLGQIHHGVRQCAHSRLTAALSLVLLAGLASGVEAVDEVQLIDQDLALAGGVTPGDQPGFPVTITRAGSYHLSGNLRVSMPNVHVVEIAADNVALDLNGFTIQGPGDQCSRRLVPIWCSYDCNLGSGIGVGTIRHYTPGEIPGPRLQQPIAHTASYGNALTRPVPSSQSRVRHSAERSECASSGY